MVEKAPSVKTPNQPPSKRRRAAATVLTALLLPACVPDIELEDNEPVVCELSDDKQEFTFSEGEGEQDAAHAIKGSGQGEGDPCWPEAINAVEKALEKTHARPGVPQMGWTIEVPESVAPVDESNQ